MRYRRNNFFSIIFIFLLLAPAGLAVAKYKTKVFETRVPVRRGPCRMVLINPAGLVKLTAKDLNVVQVKVQKMSETRDPDQIQIVAEPGPPIHLEARMPVADRPVIQDMPYVAHWEVAYPARCAVELRYKVGGVQLTGARARVTVEGINGNIYMDKVQGDIDIKILNGSIRVDHTRGTLVMENIGGNIDITGHRGCLQVRSTNARIRATLVEVPASCLVRVATVNHHVELYLPVGESAKVDLQTVLGRIMSEFAMEIERQEARWEKRLIGRIGATGGNTDYGLVVRTVNGNIVLNRNLEATP